MRDCPPKRPRSIWLARTLPAGWRLVTLERDERRAEVARAAIAAAGLSDVVDLRLGPALDILPRLAADGVEPFDLVFLERRQGREPGLPAPGARAVAPGTLIAADNVVRGGAVLDPPPGDRSAAGARRFLELLAAEPRLTATAVQTVGAKRHGGFALALVDGPPGRTPFVGPPTPRVE